MVCERCRLVVREALRSLPEKERAALVLRDIEGLSTREVAKALGSSETTIRSQISRARLKLKQARDRLLRRTL
jgi:RNA polymerase sigma-70 factor (ECF subfamily)